MISSHFARIGLFLSVMLSACGGGGSDAPPPEHSETQLQPLKVYIFAGQSNMNGSDAVISTATGVLDLVDMGLQTDVDRSSLFTMATPATGYAWGDIRGHNGYHLGEPTINGKPVKVHGPEVGFNRYLGGNMAIIKYANNYQALENGHSPWIKPGSRWTSWQSFVDQQLAALGRPYKVVGVVWFQGIDDGLLARSTTEYKADLLQMLADLRTKFGNVPVVLGRSVISPIAGPAAMELVRTAQVEVGNMPGNAWINVDDLQVVADHHLSSAAQLEVGRRFAVEMERLQR